MRIGREYLPTKAGYLYILFGRWERGYCPASSTYKVTGITLPLLRFVEMISVYCGNLPTCGSLRDGVKSFLLLIQRSRNAHVFIHPYNTSTCRQV